MAQKIYIGISNSSKRTKQMYVGINNQSKKLKSIYIGVNDHAKAIFQHHEILLLPSQTGSLTYNESTQSPTWDTYTSQELSQYFTITGASQINAGTHTATFTPNEGYFWYDTDTQEPRTQLWSINKRSVAVTWSGTSKTYNSSSQSVSYSLSTSISVTGTNISATNAGTYTASLTPNDSTNNTLTNASVSWTIAKRTVSVTWSGTSKTYNGSSQSVSYSLSTSISVNTSGLSATNAGSYTASLTAVDSANNTLSNASVSWSIAKRTVTVSWSNTVRIYSGSTQSVTYSVSPSGTVNTGGTHSATGPGTYTASVSLKDSANNTLSGSSSCGWGIYVCHNSSNTYYTALQTAINTGGYIYMDCNLSQNLTLASGATLNTNGKTLTGLVSHSSGTSAIAGSGKIYRSATAATYSDGIGVIYNSGGTLNISGSTIELYSTSTSYECNGIVVSGGTVNVSGGSIYSHNGGSTTKGVSCGRVFSSSAYLNISGGTHTATSTTAGNAYGISFDPGRGTISGGYFTVKSSSGRGCGTGQWGSSTVTVSGGSFDSWGGATATYYSSGVLCSGGSLTVTGGFFRVASSYGASSLVGEGGSITLTSGSFGFVINGKISHEAVYNSNCTVYGNTSSYYRYCRQYYYSSYATRGVLYNRGISYNNGDWNSWKSS